MGGEYTIERGSYCIIIEAGDFCPACREHGPVGVRDREEKGD